MDGCCVRDAFVLEGEDVFWIVGADFPEMFGEVAVLRAGKLLVTAGAIEKLGFEFPGGVFADVIAVLSVGRFVIAGEGVAIHAVFEGSGVIR